MRDNKKKIDDFLKCGALNGNGIYEEVRERERGRENKKFSKLIKIAISNDIASRTEKMKKIVNLNLKKIILFCCFFFFLKGIRFECFEDRDWKVLKISRIFFFDHFVIKMCKGECDSAW